MTEKPNMRKLANGTYVVRTQAGFRRAIKDYFDEYELRSVSEIDGYPTAYPSVVRFNFLHGWNKPQAFCTPLNKYLQHLKGIVSDLENE